jgi:hypothetical protein
MELHSLPWTFGEGAFVDALWSAQQPRTKEVITLLRLPFCLAGGRSGLEWEHPRGSNVYHTKLRESSPLLLAPELLCLCYLSYCSLLTTNHTHHSIIAPTPQLHLQSSTVITTNTHTMDAIKKVRCQQQALSQQASLHNMYMMILHDSP